MIAANEKRPLSANPASAETVGRRQLITDPNTVKRLPTSFKLGGFRFRLVCREGRIALFEKSKGERNRCFELVRIRRLPARMVFGAEYPASEAMPVSERWGVDGFTYCDCELERARAKFRELAEAQDRPALCTRQPANRRSRAGKASAEDGLDG